jgi:hypothetical protein
VSTADLLKSLSPYRSGRDAGDAFAAHAPPVVGLPLRYARREGETCTVRAHTCFPYTAEQIAAAAAAAERWAYQLERVVGGAAHARLIVAALNHLETVRRLDDAG